MKVVEKIREVSEKGGIVYSFEFVPPRAKKGDIDGFEQGVKDVLETIDRMVEHGPSFCDITWRAGGTNAERVLRIAKEMQNTIGVETMVHLTCMNMPLDEIDHALDTMKANGIQNVLALKGDPPVGKDQSQTVENGFSCALDLVNYIKARYGDYFGITVAGYPEAHPDKIQSNGLADLDDYKSDLVYLKRKVDAGADVIISQLFFDTDIFLKFIKDCREEGITCPIVPGILPITTYRGYLRMIGICKTWVPAEVTAALEPIKGDDESIRNYGIELATKMCKKLLAYGIKTLHFYTLNQDKSTLAILQVTTLPISGL
ncbi:hypothetical protein GIB67_001506 [Kingdonia uniflora]|uniref:Methylenetetrahydrofolate reductase n=1 Tax=Kingdonia uniflora TaxID=39325 RepID=A0A7J7LUZ8_9MAGN|nr:hypothetical protein GIB67_001506 [Kingdonia uniflora]